MRRSLDIRHRLCYACSHLAHPRAHSGCDPVCGARRGACARSRKPLPGGFGHHALRHQDRGGRCCPCTGLASERVTPACAESQEAWPGAEPGGQSPGESRMRSAGRRARPESRCVAQTAYTCLRRAPRPKGAGSWRHLVCAAMVGCASRRSASLFDSRERLSFLLGVVVAKTRTRLAPREWNFHLVYCRDLYPGNPYAAFLAFASEESPYHLLSLAPAAIKGPPGSRPE